LNDNATFLLLYYERDGGVTSTERTQGATPNSTPQGTGKSARSRPVSVHITGTSYRFDPLAVRHAACMACHGLTAA